MMVDSALEALFIVFQPVSLGMLLTGVLVGVVVGILPGLGGIVGMCIFIPFIWDMEPHLALLLFMGMLAILRTVDTVPAVLFAVPGTGGSMATIVDGYPMAKKGEAARATYCTATRDRSSSSPRSLVQKLTRTAT